MIEQLRKDKILSSDKPYVIYKKSLKMTEVMRSRNSKDRQYNGQKIRDRQCSTKINVTMDNPEKLTT